MDAQYDTLRRRLAAALKRDASLHKLHRYDKLGDGFLDFRSQLRQGGDQRYQKLVVAMQFWDAWIMARNTDWLEYAHIPEATWGDLADTVVADLLADRDVTDARVLAAFDLTSTLELPKRTGLDREASPLDDV
jgi:hypothetical protein